MPGGSLNVELPQAIVKPHNVTIENKRNGCSGARFFIAYLVPSGMTVVADTSLARSQQMFRLRGIIPQKIKMPSNNL
jgi:hypothetical protein